MRTLITVAACAVAASSAAAVDAFTDLAAFEAAAGGPAALDDFSSYGLVDLTLGSNDFFNGYSVSLAGSDTGGTNINSATNLVFTVGADLQSITFNFDQAINGFGGTSLNSFVSNGLTVTINGESFNVEDSIAAPSFEFVGFAGSESFTSATLTVTDPAGASEFAALSEIYIAVPTPAGVGAFALLGLAATRRRR